MKYILRQDARARAGWRVVVAVAAVVFTGLGGLSGTAWAGDSGVQMVTVIDETPALLMHASQGYLGVTINDIDAGRANDLHLKDVRGAEIVNIDHDAPACKAGLKVHDVILQMNGQPIEGVEQLRRMLRETPVGRTASFVIWRDGQSMNTSVQLGDRAKLEQMPFISPYSVPDPDQATSTEVYIPLRGQAGGQYGNGFFGDISPNPLYVGAMVDPVGAQLADYFGVKNGTGLLVKSVDENSPAGSAGMKAGDVVLKVNGKTMVSQNDWLRAIHANRGKQVQVTVVRNRKEQTVTMWAGTPKHKG